MKLSKGYYAINGRDNDPVIFVLNCLFVAVFVMLTSIL